MPDLKEILKDRNVKKFTKKTYRPWDLSGNGLALNISNTIEPDLPLKKKNVIKRNNVTEIEIIDKSIAEHIETPKELDNKIDSDKVSNIYQTDSKLGTYQTSIEYQIDNAIENNESTKGYQLDNLQDNTRITTTNSLYENITLEKTEVDAEIKQMPTLNKNEEFEIFQSILEQDIIRLSGKQKIIFDVVIDICSARQSLETGPLQTGTLATVSQTTIGTIKTTLKRLIDKKLLIRYPGKNAKGGYINLGITNQILDLVNNIKNNNKSNLFASDIILANRYQKDINHDIYSSNSINNITTNNVNRKVESIPSEWESINYDPLSHIGFSKTQIKQMIGKNEPIVVQESIYHFAFGLEHNQKFKKYEDPLNVLMGVLRKGQGWVESEYRSASEIAQIKFLESKKAEIARKKTLEEEAFKLAFNEWDEGINENEREKLTVKKNGDLTPSVAKLSKHFRDNIWPTLKNNYILMKS